jgi:hypothetical protein
MYLKSDVCVFICIGTESEREVTGLLLYSKTLSCAAFSSLIC